MNQRLLLILILVLSSFSLYSNGDSRFDYADFLFSTKQYNLAIHEYYRSMYKGTYEDTIRSYFSIADCYIKSQKYIEASNAYEQIENLDNKNWDAIKRHVKLLNNMQYFYESNKIIDKYLLNLTQDKQDSLRLYKAVNLINLEDFDNARATLDLVTTENPRQRAKIIEEQMNSELPLSYKSKVKASLMQAILPGSGYLYCKMPQTAFATLIVNSLIGYVTVDNFQRKNYGTGVFFSVIGTGFYLGSIYGSMQAVAKYNQREFEMFSSKIKP